MLSLFAGYPFRHEINEIDKEILSPIGYLSLVLTAQREKGAPGVIALLAYRHET